MGLGSVRCCFNTECAEVGAQRAQRGKADSSTAQAGAFAGANAEEKAPACFARNDNVGLGRTANRERRARQQRHQTRNTEPGTRNTEHGTQTLHHGGFLVLLGGSYGEELGLVGLDGVEEGVQVVGARGGEFGSEEMVAAGGVQFVAVDGIF